MNKTILTLILATSLVTSAHAQNTTAAPASAGPLADLTVTGAMDYESQYVFRGKKITGSAFQPSINFAYPVYSGSLNAYLWTSQPIGSKSGVGPDQTNEIDLGIFYTYPLANLWKDVPVVKDSTIDVGYQYYWYPDNVGATAFPPSRNEEFHLGWQYDTTSVLAGYNINPQLYYYHDVILDANTVQLSVSYTWDVSDLVGVKGLSIVPSANIGYTAIGRVFGDQAGSGAPHAAGYNGNWKDGYTYWAISLQANYALNKWCTAFFGVRYSGNNDGTSGGIGGAATNPQPVGSGENNVWIGAGLSFGP